MPRRSPKKQNSIRNPTAFDPSYDDHEHEKNFVLPDQTPWHWNSPLALPPKIHWTCTVAPSTTSTWKSRWCNEHLASGWNGWRHSVYFLTQAMWDVKTMISKVALQIIPMLSLATTGSQKKQVPFFLSFFLVITRVKTRKKLDFDLIFLSVLYLF